MESKFDFGAVAVVLEKAAKDETGQIAALINDLILVATKAGKADLNLQEVATLTTLGWYVSQQPELQNIVNFLLNQTQPPDELLN